MIPCIVNVQNRQIYRDRKQISRGLWMEQQCVEEVGMRNDCQWLLDGFRGNENILKSDSGGTSLVVRWLRICLADEWIRKLWYIYTVEYYSAIKKNSFESVLMRWMKLEPIIQSELSQKDKDHYSILTHIYGIQKDGNDNPICKTEKEPQMYRTDFWTLGRVQKSLLQTFGRRRGWDVSREQHRNMYIIQGETDHQPSLDA